MKARTEVPVIGDILHELEVPTIGKIAPFYVSRNEKTGELERKCVTCGHWEEISEETLAGSINSNAIIALYSQFYCECCGNSNVHVLEFDEDSETED